jgi:hypothetical protein
MAAATVIYMDGLERTVKREGKFAEASRRQSAPMAGGTVFSTQKCSAAGYLASLVALAMLVGVRNGMLWTSLCLSQQLQSGAAVAGHVELPPHAL